MLLEPEELSSEFPLTGRMAYLDVAYHGLMPVSVARAMDTFCREQLGGGGLPSAWERDVERTREKLARLIGAKPAEIAFVKSTAEGINAVAAALPLREGDNVLLNDLEHASNAMPWRNRESQGIEVRVVPSVGGRVPVESLLAAADRRTRAIAIAAVHLSTGFRADLAALAEHCRPNGICLVVDAVQALGTMAVDVRALGVDALSSGAQKGLLGPYGVGGLYVREELIGDLRPAYLAGEGVYGEGRLKEVRPLDDARRFEIGNYNFPGLAGLSAALDLLLRVGIGEIERHVLALGDRLVEGLARRNVPVVSSLREGERSGLVVFSLPDPARAVQHFEANGVRLSPRRGNLRASLHLYNTSEDVDRLLSLVGDCVATR